MTGQERRHCMWLLRRAKTGELGAYDALTREVVRHFGYTIREYRPVDPAVDRDDMLQTFRVGVWQSIERVDHRGDPLYHLAQRGLWAVTAMLSVLKRRRYGTEKWKQDFGTERSIGTLPEGFDLPDPAPESDPAFVVEARESQDMAHERVVEILAHTDLSGRMGDVVTWMMTDPAPDEKGANKRLAGQLGVSEQRASVLRKRVTDKLAEA